MRAEVLRAEGCSHQAFLDAMAGLFEGVARGQFGVSLGSVWIFLDVLVASIEFLRFQRP